MPTPARKLIVALVAFTVAAAVSLAIKAAGATAFMAVWHATEDWPFWTRFYLAALLPPVVYALCAGVVAGRFRPNDPGACLKWGRQTAAAAWAFASLWLALIAYTDLAGVPRGRPGDPPPATVWDTLNAWLLAGAQFGLLVAAGRRTGRAKLRRQAGQNRGTVLYGQVVPDGPTGRRSCAAGGCADGRPGANGRG